MLITDEHRQSVRNPKTRLSEKAAARLATLSEFGKAERDGQKQFVDRFSEVLAKVNKRCNVTNNVHLLMSILQRCSTDQSNLERRALKLRRCLAMGWTVKSVGDVLFCAELTAEEAAISDSEFYERVTADWPRPSLPRPSLPTVKRSRNRISAKATVQARASATS